MNDYCPNCGRPNGGWQYCPSCGSDLANTPTLKIVDGVLISCNRNAGYELILPSYTVAIGKEAFKDCGNLYEVILPAGVTSIGEGAFSGCLKLEEINIPNGVMTIKARTFEDCWGLWKIILPDSVTSIEENAFLGCKYLRVLSVPQNCEIPAGAIPEGCKIERRQLSV